MPRKNAITHLWSATNPLIMSLRGEAFRFLSVKSEHAWLDRRSLVGLIAAAHRSDGPQWRSNDSAAARNKRQKINK